MTCIDTYNQPKQIKLVFELGLSLEHSRPAAKYYIPTVTLTVAQWRRGIFLIIIPHFTFAQHYSDYSSMKQCKKHLKAEQKCLTKSFLTPAGHFGAKAYPGIM